MFSSLVLHIFQEKNKEKVNWKNTDEETMKKLGIIHSRNPDDLIYFSENDTSILMAKFRKK